MQHPAPPDDLPSRLLRGSAAIWFIPAAAGQLVFAFYIVMLYGGASLSGDAAAWNTVMQHGLVDDDPRSNVALIAHVLLAGFITVAGLLQLTPQIRNAFPTFHRWIGRTYLSLAVIIAITGLYVTWVRSAPSGLSNDLSISLNGVLILIFASLAVRYAIERRIDIHRRWATRLFFAVSGVWCLRLLVSGWIVFHQAPLWLGENLQGPMGVTFGFASYLLPLAVYELYLRAGDSKSAAAKLAMAGVVVGFAGLTAFCVFAASMILWLPHT